MKNKEAKKKIKKNEKRDESKEKEHEANVNLDDIAKVLDTK